MHNNQKLRIALFFSSNPTNAGGVQEHILYLSEELRKRGHSVDIFGPQGTSKQYKNYHDIGYTIQVPLPNGNWTSIQMLKPFINLEKVFDKNKFDLLHVHEPYIPILGWQMIDLDIPKVSTFHAAWDNNSIVNALNNIVPLFREKFSSRMNAAIFVSGITQKRWEGLCLKNVAKYIVYNAVDRDQFYPKQKNSNERIRLLFLGRVVSRKGIMELLKAFSFINVKFPHVILDIVGGGAEVENVNLYIKKHNLNHCIKYRGEIIGTKRVSYYQKADIFCAPYSDEASPLTILEAMRCGCTIVGFQNEANKESLAQYPYPELLVEQKNIKALAAALSLAISNAQIRQRTFEWCIQESQKYSWNSVAESTEKVYLKAIKDYYA